MLIDIKSGDIDGVDVSGVTVAWSAEWPKGFLSGEGKGRVYFDPSTSSEQRAALEPVITGQEGGDLEPVGGVVPTWLDSQEASIEVSTSDGTTRFTVGDVGEGVLDPIRNPAGEVTRVLAMPSAFAPETILGRGQGSRWTDPDLRQWESRGHAEQAEFEWSG
jgi:hypothetical protein